MTDATTNFEKGSIVDHVFRWNSNGQVPFEDMLWSFVNAGLITQQTYCISNETRKEEVRKSLEDYRNHAPAPDAEQLSEMRAAFGEGTVVVNALTGRRTQL